MCYTLDILEKRCCHVRIDGTCVQGSRNGTFKKIFKLIYIKKKNLFLNACLFSYEAVVLGSLVNPLMLELGSGAEWTFQTDFFFFFLKARESFFFKENFMVLIIMMRFLLKLVLRKCLHEKILNWSAVLLKTLHFFSSENAAPIYTHHCVVGVERYTKITVCDVPRFWSHGSVHFGYS